MKGLHALRAVARVELRDLRRHRGRSLLIVLLVAVPVAALAGAGALVRTMQPTLEERRAERFGAADVRFESSGPEGTAVELARAARAVLPATARVTVVRPATASLLHRGVRVHALALANTSLEGGPDLAEGQLALVGGRAPRAAGEVALSPTLADALSVGLGDVVEVDGRASTVVGSVLRPERLSDPLVTRVADDAPSFGDVWLVALPEDERDAAVAELRRLGFDVERQSDVAPADGFEDLVLFVIGGLGFVEAALVVAAAFAVGVRRRQRELGLLAATGAPRHLLGWGLLVAPACLAAVGVALGSAIGLAAARVAVPWLDGWNDRLNGPFEVSLVHAVGGGLLGLAIAIAAAALPVRTALGLPIRTALSGRRPPAGRARGWLGLGVTLIAGGVAVLALGLQVEGEAAALAILGGSVFAVLGLGCTSPWLLQALAGSAARLAPAWRLAVRDAGRFRARNAPVVTAVLAGLSASLLLAALIASLAGFLGGRTPTLRSDQIRVEGPDAASVAADLAAQLGGRTARVDVLLSSGRSVFLTTVGAEATGAATLRPAPASAELLAASGLAASAIDTVLASRAVWLFAPEAPPESLALRVGDRTLATLAVRVLATDEPSLTPRAVVPLPLVRELGLEVGAPVGAPSSPWLVQLDRPVSAADFERARELAAGVVGTAVDAERLRAEPTRGVLFVALLFAMGTGLLVVFIATALSSVESAHDKRVLEAVGASPALLHRTDAARAAYLALLGSVLAVPGGLLPGYGLVALSDVPLEFTVPWRVIALVVLGMPTLAWTGAWVASRARSPLSVRATSVVAETL